MILLRLFLYVVCISSIGWSLLVFGGPLIIKKVILEYTNGSVVPSGITISPALEIKINRFDFNLENEMSEIPFEGFSRATEISWSVIGKKPFLDINFGPSVLKKYLSVDSLQIFTPPLREIDWQSLFLVSNVKNLNLNSTGKAEAVKIVGNVNLESSKASNLQVEAQSISAEIGNSNYQSNFVVGRLSGLNFYTPLEEQQFYSNFSMKDISVSGANLISSEGSVKISFGAASRNINVELQDLKLPEFGGLVKEVKIDGSYGRRYALNGLDIAISSGTFANGWPNFSDLLARVVKTNEQNYDAQLTGSLGELEISNSDNFLGVLPDSNFTVDLKVDKTFTNVVAQPQVMFISPELKEFLVSANINFGFERLPNMNCLAADCKLSNFDATYQLKFNNEWVDGTAVCLKQFCSFEDMSYSVRTSHTTNLLTGLSQSGVLSPISSIYLYGVLGSGKKIDSGHELNF